MKEILEDRDDSKRQTLLSVPGASDEEIAGEVYTDSTEAESYWKVLEHGSAPNASPWPQPREKTRRGRGGRIFSKQAPQGFVHVHDEKFIRFLREEYARIARAKNRPLTKQELESAAMTATRRAQELIQAGAPMDSGQLKNSIKARRSG